MSDVKPDGGPAFPLPSMILEDGRGYPAQPGMTLRQWYAGHALAGIITSGANRYEPNYAAARAFSFADAMIAAEGTEQ